MKELVPNSLEFELETRKLGSEGENFYFDVSPKVRSAEASRLGLLAINFLRIDGAISLMGDGTSFCLHVHFLADVLQSCVVTLEPVRSELDESFELCYAPDKRGFSGLGSGFFDPLKEDGPEPLINGKIDIGGVVMEHLVLALEAYPRKPGVKFNFKENYKDKESKYNPFADLLQNNTNSKF